MLKPIRPITEWKLSAIVFVELVGVSNSCPTRGDMLAYMAYMSRLDVLVWACAVVMELQKAFGNVWIMFADFMWHAWAKMLKEHGGKILLTLAWTAKNCAQSTSTSCEFRSCSCCQCPLHSLLYVGWKVATRRSPFFIRHVMLFLHSFRVKKHWDCTPACTTSRPSCFSVQPDWACFETLEALLVV